MHDGIHAFGQRQYRRLIGQIKGVCDELSHAPGTDMQAIGADDSTEGNARVVAARQYMAAAGIPSISAQP